MRSNYQFEFLQECVLKTINNESKKIGAFYSYKRSCGYISRNFHRICVCRMRSADIASDPLIPLTHLWPERNSTSCKAISRTHANAVSPMPRIYSLYCWLCQRPSTVKKECTSCFESHFKQRQDLEVQVHYWLRPNMTHSHQALSLPVSHAGEVAQ